MNQPIHSRGTGRSGPKRKTGCITCRRRKVRCDEQRPSCSNCIRLRLDCHYVEKAKQTLSSPSSSDTPTKSETTPNENNPMAILPPADMPTDQLWAFGNDPSLAYAQPFQDMFFSTLDNFDTGVDFPSSTAFIGPEVALRSFENMTVAPEIPAIPVPDAPTDSNRYNEERRKALVQHFLKSANPVSVILPTHSEWTSACRTLLAMATESSFLLHGICALSALHLYATRSNDSYDEAFALYKLSSRQVNVVLDGTEVDDRQLKPAFATVFLLTHVELLAQTTSSGKTGSWPLNHLQRAHHRVRQHSERIRTWTGTSKRLLTWLTLLQAKAEYNSGYNSLEHSSSTLSASIGDPFTKDQFTEDVEDDTRTMSELAYDTINQPGLDFFLKSQAFTSRIISLDRYHRQRGTMETEFETFKDAQQVTADLDKLWATRPTTMAFLNQPKNVADALQPNLAARILLNLRVYSANFWALYIYLHRVAYKTYPAGKEVFTAVARILGYARDILSASCETNGIQIHPQAGNGQQQLGPTTSLNGVPFGYDQDTGYNNVGAVSDSGLPATMLWPLFLAALECSVTDRFWLLQTMREMDLRQVPNAARTVLLLEEVLRRQDQEGRRVDHRSVRQDLFEGELSVLY